ncbi:MAG: DMP19 family protein [Bacteroidales bacterium]|nr:DMP19 family protein [Bacteroidales bacterium]
MKIEISESALIAAAQQEGYDAFVNTVANAIKTNAGGELTAEILQKLTAEQITLWGFTLLHEEVMDGGFVQLIYNGYGPFIFLNPLAKALRLWGLKDLSKLLYDGRALYELHGRAIESEELSDDEFMALFEQYPDFDDLDDRFIESEEYYMQLVAEYIDQHLEHFVQVS